VPGFYRDGAVRTAGLQICCNGLWVLIFVVAIIGEVQRSESDGAEITRAPLIVITASATGRPVARSATLPPNTGCQVEVEIETCSRAYPPLASLTSTQG